MSFFINWQTSNARTEQEKHIVCFGNALPQANARAHLKQIKKHSGLIIVSNRYMCAQLVPPRLYYLRGPWSKKNEIICNVKLSMLV